MHLRNETCISNFSKTYKSAFFLGFRFGIEWWLSPLKYRLPSPFWRYIRRFDHSSQIPLFFSFFAFAFLLFFLAILASVRGRGGGGYIN